MFTESRRHSYSAQIRNSPDVPSRLANKRVDPLRTQRTQRTEYMRGNERRREGKGGEKEKGEEGSSKIRIPSIRRFSGTLFSPASVGWSLFRLVVLVYSVQMEVPY